MRLLMIADCVSRDFNSFHCRGIKENRCLQTKGKLSTFVNLSSVFLSIILDIVDFVWNLFMCDLGTRMTSAEECHHYNDRETLALKVIQVYQVYR